MKKVQNIGTKSAFNLNNTISLFIFNYLFI